MTRQDAIGRWVQALGQFLLAGLVLVSFLDVSGLATRHHLLVPLSCYLQTIMIGAGMQVVGAAIPHLRFAHLDG